MKNEKLLLDIQRKCGHITNEILNAMIDAEWSFKCMWPSSDFYVQEYMHLYA